MNSKELADKLNGCNYRNEITDELAKEAKENNLVVVFGASDDLMEFRGAVYDEVGAYDGGLAFINENGLVKSECEEDCPYYQKELQKATRIEAKWCPKNNDGDIYASWLIVIGVPHYSFDVMEDGELYCRGIVFSLSGIK